MTDHEGTPQTGEVHNTMAEMRELWRCAGGWARAFASTKPWPPMTRKCAPTNGRRQSSRCEPKRCSWRHNCGGPDLCLIRPYANSAIAAARGEGFQPEPALSITDEQRRRVAGTLPTSRGGRSGVGRDARVDRQEQTPGAGPTCPTHETAKYRDPHGEWRCTKCRAGNKRSALMTISIDPGDKHVGLAARGGWRTGQAGLKFSPQQTIAELEPFQGLDSANGSPVSRRIR